MIQDPTAKRTSQMSRRVLDDLALPAFETPLMLVSCQNLSQVCQSIEERDFFFILEVLTGIFSSQYCGFTSKPGQVEVIIVWVGLNLFWGTMNRGNIRDRKCVNNICT